MVVETNNGPTGNRRGFSLRFARVLIYFALLILNVLWWDVILGKIGMGTLARRTSPGRYKRWANRFVRLATRLGGIWIKVGQFLSARVDVLPQSVTAELSRLQDEVPAESFSDMYAVIRAEFGDEVDDNFAWFDEEPLASASLGQVHRARLPEGDDVVVKVQRPGIDQLIRIDLDALRVVSGWLKHFKPIARRADLDALYAEFSRTIWEEIDYLAEADNARRFKAMFAEDARIRIPGVYKKQTTKRVLTLEDVFFVKITDYEAIKAVGVDPSQVAERLFGTYLRQIFIEGFFHADPHPGNLFVEPLDDGNWKLVFVDFGMVGNLKPEAKKGLRELAIGVATKDAHRLVDAYQLLDMLLPSANLDRIRQAEAAVFERYWGKSMRELATMDIKEMHQFARDYRDILYEMPFQIPSDLIFLGRCLAILSGICTGLDPDFNLFENLSPFAKDLLTEEREDIIRLILDWIEQQARIIAALPKRVDSILEKIESGELVITARPTAELDRRLQGLTAGINHLVSAVMFAALLVTGALLYLSGEQIIGAGLMGLSIITLWWVLIRQ
jgi:predicted unusual protein kinase regulating ubiquinone biosynthesis (AarF/ABC1/UbiB family)